MSRRNIVLITLISLGISAQSLAMDLQETVLHALQSNPEMRAALNEFEARKYEVKQARAAYLPSVSVDAGIGEEQRRSPATGNDRVELTRRELGLSASQLLFDGFSSSAEIGRQKARVDAAEYDLKGTGDRVALRTVEVYLDVLRHAALLDLARASLWDHQNIYDQMEVRHKTGVGSKADLDQIAARLALAHSNMVVAQNNFADAQIAFHRLSGLFPNLESMAKPEALPGLPASRELAQEKALENHPALMSAAADVRAAQQQYKASGANYWPELRLEADKRWDENLGGIEGEDEDLIVALRLKYTLFAGGADKARRKQSAFLMEEAKDVRNNARRQVIESLNLSWNAFDAYSQQLPYLQQHVDSAQATKVAYVKQFNIGRRTLLDLLNTENEVVESKRALLNADFNLAFTRYRILAALGELTQHFAGNN